VSIDTLVGVVKPHVVAGRLQLVVLTGCCTSRLAAALRDRADVPDVICWETLVHDVAAKVFGEAFAKAVSRQVEQLEPAAAFDAACTAVKLEREEGFLDTGLAGLVQKFELVDPRDTAIVGGDGRLIAYPTKATKGRLAAGKPLHLQKGLEPSTTSDEMGSSSTDVLACFAVPAAITEQMTQEVKSKARSQLPEGMAFEDHYPELVLSYASGRRAEDCEGAGPGMIYAAGLLGILHELLLQTQHEHLPILAGRDSQPADARKAELVKDAE